MTGPRILSESQVAEAVERIRSGESFTAVGDSMGVSPAAISWHCNRAGVRSARAYRIQRGSADQDQARLQALALRKTGLGYASIAKRVGVSTGLAFGWTKHVAVQGAGR